MVELLLFRGSCELFTLELSDAAFFYLFFFNYYYLFCIAKCLL